MNTNKRGRRTLRAAFARRLMSLALAAVMLWSLLPGLTPAAAAAEWMEPYLEQLVEWGVMRGSSSGNLNPDRVLTRAEFVTMINRAFGYTERGNTPFQDVPANAWYADDINIAYQAGYFTGTSETTAGPLGRVTREQAAVLLGRNLRLQGIPGVNSDFTDVHRMGNWSRGMVQECAELGIIQGYADGTFRPQNYITRGQMACFLVRALGTLVHETGDQIAGGVYGNLTVNTSGVKLKDTVITGNLYLSGGVGLGSVELENVTVMGKIVVCGAGEAERGESSIILRNVTAEAMEIDSLSDNFMTIRTEGLTNIANTTVRTSAYLEDVTDDDMGLRVITLDGTSDGTLLQLAGNIKEVVNITPNSNLQVVQGVTHKLTVDERATGSALSIANDTTVKILNLDAGTPVTGNGDVDKMNINAAGSSATMLPDSIFIRPGIESNINNKVMDSVAAEESSDEPRLLAGYPLVRNLASTSADGVFSTNKRGTLYWAVSALLDGSAGEDELRDPSAYPGKILRSGTINVTASKTEMTARLTGLSREGSYYLAAMLVDERGHASPVKVTAFTTTDDSVPAFATGYPEAVVYVTEDNEQIVQARVMATKTCRLYYALLPQNASAPTANDMRSGAISGNLGYGTMELRKNTAYTIPRVNTAYLQEKTTYALYLWLNDADSGKSSAVRRLNVTTKDVTPPVIQRLEATGMTGTSITMTYSLDEPGTLYWVIVKKGTPFYSKDIEEVGTPPSQANNELAKMQIKRGLGVKRGSSNAARESTDVSFTITGLQPQTAYDLYYVAEDRDGNFNIYTTTLTPPMQVNTLDEQGPTVSQEFTHDGSDGNTQHPTPYTDTSIRLIFSEEVQGIDATSQQEPSKFLDLYNRGESALLAAALTKHIRLYYKPALDQPILLTAEHTPYGWIDFSKARVEPDASGSGELIITFPQEGGGLGLASGATYYFELEGIYDTATPQPNQMQGTTRGILKLPEFTTLFATVNLTASSERNIQVNGATVPVDRSFTVTPTDTDTVSDETYWDMLFWSDTTMTYSLYVRKSTKNADGKWSDWGAWEVAREDIPVNVAGAPDGRVYASYDGYITAPAGGTQSDFPKLKEMVRMEFAIAVDDDSVYKDPNDTNQNINMEIMVLAGDLNTIEALAGYGDHGRTTNLETALNSGAVQINVPKPFPVTIPLPGKAPELIDGYPEIEAGDTAATLWVKTDRPGKVYYLWAKVRNSAELTDVEQDWTDANNTTYTRLTGITYRASVEPQDGSGRVDLSQIYSSGALNSGETLAVLTDPKVNLVTADGANSSDMTRGSQAVQGGSAEQIPLKDLEANTHYLLYLVTEDANGVKAEKAVCYQFKTGAVKKPVLELNVVGENGYARTDRAANVKATLIVQGGYDLLNKDFSIAAGTVDASKTFTPPRNPYTVLDALADRYPTTGVGIRGSIFDEYASKATKDSLYGVINSSSFPPNVIIDPIGMFYVPGGEDWTTPRAFNVKNKNAVFTFLAFAESPLGSEPSFSAVANVQFRNDEWPRVSSVTLTWEPVTDTTYKQRVTIVFTKDLYFREGMNPVVPVTPTGPGTYTDKEWIASTLIVEDADPWKAVSTTGTTPQTTRQVRFERTTSNPTGSNVFVFRDGLCDEWENRPQTGGGFNVTVNITYNKDTNDYEATLSNIPPLWDGRGN